jgi:uncharacterized protein YdaU (DUF1376 family)
MGSVLTINRNPQDFVAQTQHLSIEDSWAYQRICDYIVILGQDEEPPSLPDDDTVMANLLGWAVSRWRKTKATLCAGPPLGVLLCEGDRITQVRVAAEILEAKERIEKASSAGKASGLARAKKQVRAAMANGRTNGRSNTRSNASSTPVRPELQLAVNLEATNYELRTTNLEEEPEISTTTSPVLGANAGHEIIRRYLAKFAPQLLPATHGDIWSWLTQIHHDPWWIAAAIAQGWVSLPGARSLSYVTKLLQNAKRDAEQLPESFDWQEYAESLFDLPERHAARGVVLQESA